MSSVSVSTIERLVGGAAKAARGLDGPAATSVCPGNGSVSWWPTPAALSAHADYLGDEREPTSVRRVWWTSSNSNELIDGRYCRFPPGEGARVDRGRCRGEPTVLLRADDRSVEGLPPCRLLVARSEGAAHYDRVPAGSRVFGDSGQSSVDCHFALASASATRRRPLEVVVANSYADDVGNSQPSLDLDSDDPETISSNLG